MKDGIDVLIDVQAVSGRKAGVPNVAYGLVPAMLKRDDDINYFVSGREETLSLVMGGDHSARAEVWLRGGTRAATRILSQHFMDKIRINRLNPKVYFALATLLPYGISSRTAKIALIHDLAPFRVPGIYTPVRQRYHRWLLKSVAERAEHLVSVSQATKQDLVELLSVPEERVTVIPNATQAEVYHADAEELRRERTRLKLPDRFILFVGKVQPRKNLARLIEAFGSISGGQTGKDVELVIVGGNGWMIEDILAAHGKSPVKDRIRFCGHVADADLRWYYRCAEVFAYPSLYEGFGLPILEAMAAGVPVVASSTGAMREVAGDAGIACDPYSIESIGEALRVALEDGPTRRKSIVNGYRRVLDFSWEKSADGYASLWKRYTG